MPIHIDFDTHPTQLSFLYNLFSDSKSQSVWYSNKPYFLNEQDIIFSNDIIRVVDPTDNQEYFQVLANRPLYASDNNLTLIIPVLATFVLNSFHKSVNFIESEEYIVKVLMSSRTAYKHRSIRDLLSREFEKSKIAGHLGVNEPFIYDGNGYLSMLRKPGIDLFDFMDIFRKSEVMFSPQLQIMLMNAILKTVFQQVTARNLVHLDIKPENILIDVDGLPQLKKMNAYELANYVPTNVTINCVDYAYSVNFGEKNSSPCGSHLYLSPEYQDPSFKNGSPDVYAVGIIFQYIWGLLDIADQAVVTEDGERLLSRNTINAAYQQSSTYCDTKVNYPLYLNITTLTINMLRTDPSQRWSLQQVIDAFDYIVGFSISPRESLPPTCYSYFQDLVTKWRYVFETPFILDPENNSKTVLAPEHQSSEDSGNDDPEFLKDSYTVIRSSAVGFSNVKYSDKRFFSEFSKDMQRVAGVPGTLFYPDPVFSLEKTLVSNNSTKNSCS